MVKTMLPLQGSVGLIPGWETKTPHATWHGQKKKCFNGLKKKKKKDLLFSITYVGIECILTSSRDLT